MLKDYLFLALTYLPPHLQREFWTEIIKNPQMAKLALDAINCEVLLKSGGINAQEAREKEQKIIDEIINQTIFQ